MYTNCQTYCCSGTNYCDYCRCDPPSVYCCTTTPNPYTKKLYEMPSRLRATNDTVLRKSPAKSKKKGSKPKRDSADSEKTNDNNSVTELPRSSYSVSSIQLSQADSSCKYECTCQRVDNNKGKDFKLSGQNAISMKQVPPRYGDRSSVPNYSTRSSDLSREQQANYFMAVEGKKKSSYDAKKSLSTVRSRGSNQYNSSTRSSQDKRQSTFSEDKKRVDTCKCHCSCSTKVSPPKSYPSKVYRPSFKTSKSCPQLDVIDEEEPENERSSSMDASLQSRRQKSLEDSCVDFLNIICDNIMESVQRSVDCKLKEFNKQAAEKFEGLVRRLDSNEAAVKSMCCKLMDKVTEQNKLNLHELYSLLQDLLGNPKQNQNNSACEIEMGSNTAIENETICNFPYESQTIITSSNENQTRSNSSYESQTRGIPSNESQIICESSYESQMIAIPSNENQTRTIDSNENQTISNISYESQSSYKPPNEDQNHCAAQESVEPVKKSETSLSCPRSDAGMNRSDLPRRKFCCCPYSRTSIDKFHPATMKEENESDQSDERKSGGGVEESTIAHKNCSNSSSSKNLSKACKDHMGPPRRTFTMFSMTPSGRTIFNCKCSSSSRQYGGSEKAKAYVSKTLNNNNGATLDIKLNCHNTYDNYDTSGYASGPEDNNEFTVTSSGRKKLQKKASKQHCNPQTPAPITLETVNADNRQDNLSEMNINKTKRKLIQKRSKSCSSSPTLLSRL